MTDFVVFSFVSIVAFTLIGAVAGVFVSAIINPSGDRSSLISALGDITTTLIGALVGFIAGKGQGHAEGREAERQEMHRREEDDK